MNRERYENLSRLHASAGTLNYGLVVFGDHLAQREGYKDTGGLDAVHFYLIQKHHWLPRDVRSMSFDDLQFLLREELAGWTLPAEARALQDT